MTITIQVKNTMASQVIFYLYHAYYTQLQFTVWIPYHDNIRRHYRIVSHWFRDLLYNVYAHARTLLKKAIA